MIYNLGPKARPIFESILQNIQSGQLETGARLPSHHELAEEYGVATLTIRQVLSKMEEDGWIIRQQGRGTFVRKHTAPAVLIVDDEPQMIAFLTIHVRQAGYLPLAATNPAEGLALLEANPAIALVLSDIRMPEKAPGLEFIRTVRRRWPQIPFAVLTGYVDDLNELHGTPEWPILVLPKPIFAQQVEEILRLASNLVSIV